ncbi:unnamed protein product [Prunus armeniaca]
MGKKSKSKTPAEMQDSCWYRWQLLRSRGYRNSKGKATAFRMDDSGWGLPVLQRGHCRSRFQLFQKSYPNEEFFSETPSPQNLEDDVPINLED